MIDNTTNPQSTPNTTWNPSPSVECITLYGPSITTGTTMYTLVSKSEHEALKAENARLQQRIAELEAHAAKEAS